MVLPVSVLCCSLTLTPLTVDFHREEGFCNGLIKSKVFVPLLSVSAITPMGKLEATSRCDNVLLVGTATHYYTPPTLTHRPT